MAQWEFVDWLLFWLWDSNSFEFEWDKGNIEKNELKHSVSMKEAEAVFCLGEALPLGIQISPKVSEERYGIVGPTFSGRILQVVFVLRHQNVRVVSARPAHRKERKEYEKIKCQIAERI